VIERGAEIIQTVSDYWRPRRWRFISDEASEGVDVTPVLVVDLFDGFVRLTSHELSYEMYEAIQVVLCPSELPLPTQLLRHQPTQRTPKGLEIPVPKRRDVLDGLRKLMQPVKKKP
jgi:hypothetical protein